MFKFLFHLQLGLRHHISTKLDILLTKNNFGKLLKGNTNLDWYCRILSWLNKHGYKTPRGHEFKYTHVFSILKKKRTADERMEKRFEPTIENLRLELKRIKTF